MGHKDKIYRLSQSAYDPDLALLLFTSGSKGDVKLVRLSVRNDANAGFIIEYFGLKITDCSTLTLRLYYSLGLSVLHGHLAVGVILYLRSRSIIELVLRIFRVKH